MATASFRLVARCLKVDASFLVLEVAPRRKVPGIGSIKRELALVTMRRKQEPYKTALASQARHNG